MRKILLTSAGFENPRVMDCFLELLGKPAGTCRALFIPTAAIDDGARAMLPKCRGDLFSAGLLPEHITTYDLDRPMTDDELSGYDTVYFCGGDTAHLLKCVRSSGFAETLDRALDRSLLYVGVSAGSVIAAQNLPDNLGYLSRRLQVHCEQGSPCGPLPNGEISLTDAQAVCLCGKTAEIIE